MKADRPPQNGKKGKSRRERASGLVVRVEVIEDLDAAMDAIRYIAYSCVAHNSLAIGETCKPTLPLCMDERARTT